MYEPDELTGAQVKEARKRHRMSRDAFTALAGFSGASTARLIGIESRDSWKVGDRETVARVLNELDGARAQRLREEADTLTQPSSGIVRPPLTGDPYEVSNSEVQTFKQCKRKWWLAWYRGLGLRTQEFIGVRSTGTRIHRALEKWYVPDGQPRVDPRDALEAVVAEDWAQIERLSGDMAIPAVKMESLAVEFANSTNMERAMVEGYVQWLEETGADSNLRIIGSEQYLSAPLDVYVSGQQRPVNIIGLLDARAEDTNTQHTWFIDHKSVGDLESPLPLLQANEQMLHYHLLEMLSSPNADRYCDGALYNMIKRSKRSERAEPPFYAREEIRHNTHELASYRRRLVSTVQDILTTKDRLDNGEEHLDVAYPTPADTCKWKCDFFAVCSLMDNGAPGVHDMMEILYKPGNPRARYDTRGRDE